MSLLIANLTANSVIGFSFINGSEEVKWAKAGIQYNPGTFLFSSVLMIWIERYSYLLENCIENPCLLMK